uniref:Fe2OG dioxygenase domain-containing protein n=1 Tax=Helicotheca tamesis TaxID=374047 RepID=A0A7S2I1J5_9STRA|mmetsp:Transcript_4843/g.6614  ORF Transcript_4843/g.6614 Transcript_4843/m.6614 type:complete len:547 (+) Transcript_4843:126-1766(+)|eukprot:CAMPEP_0185730508 /NCGR_PEP_ID=MMETSP1171-20130828/10085_1 /TAXON_ID=374046 /ORGANISM="Helicotheca tamensis, Strain CCMP826" /LENGTH=546 /DNA_ID=CAMNT_0028399565 /DNA_START=24 /DNA_END=1664 /DNA_ORIENTATION=+
MKCTIEGWHSCTALCSRELTQSHQKKEHCDPVPLSSSSQLLTHHHHGQCLVVGSIFQKHQYHHSPFFGSLEDTHPSVDPINNSFSSSVGYMDVVTATEEKQEDSNDNNNNDMSVLPKHSYCHRQSSDDALETASLALVLAAAAAAATASAASAAVAPEDTIHNPVVVNKSPLAKNSPSLPLYQFNNNNFDHIPIINMQNSIQQISKSLNDACRNVGFFYIINHGVSSDLCSNVFALSKQLFATLTEKEKRRINNTNSKKGLRGYFQIGQEDLNDKVGAFRDDDNLGGDATKDSNSMNTAASTKYQGDFKEGFDCGREVLKDDPTFSIFGQNLWPAEEKDGSVGFREKLLEYQNEMLQLADKLLVAFAISLNLDDSQFFVKQTRDPMCTLRLLHYPPMDPPKKQDLQQQRKQNQSQLGCGAHTDYGLFTILNQDDIGGLQVLNGQKKWIEATPIPGAFVINVGDMMNRWTNGLYSSTIHRVVTNTSGKDRYSLPFFFNPNVDAVVEPFGGGSAASSSSSYLKKTYTAETAGEILVGRYEETFSHVKK